jgi:hypothetical protein
MTKWTLVALVGFPLLLAGCGKRMACTTEVTAGNGTFKAVAEGTSPQAQLERDSLVFACGQLCNPGKLEGTDEACVARCSVDAAAGKIGVRTTCSKGAR